VELNAGELEGDAFGDALRSRGNGDSISGFSSSSKKILVLEQLLILGTLVLISQQFRVSNML
jgi:hypothetical protein